MAQPYKYYYTPEEYFRMEENSIEKHEYLDGEIFVMGGGSPRHNAITVNITIEVGLGLRRKPCIAYSSDTRICYDGKKFFSYADLSVVCGQLELLPGRADTVTNPILIIEVLSPSTASYDKGKKFEQYRNIKALQSYVLIDQARVFVEHYRKEGQSGWHYETLTELEQVLKIPSLELEISLANIYDKVDFEQE